VAVQAKFMTRQLLMRFQETRTYCIRSMLRPSDLFPSFPAQKTRNMRIVSSASI
jgi:hypothetical protein